MTQLLTKALFPAVVNMSLTASIVILFILTARLLLCKAPKIFSYALWGVVLFRLLCPVSITADLSLLGLLHTDTAPVTPHTSTVEHIPHAETVVTLPTVTPPEANNSRPPSTSGNTPLPNSPDIDNTVNSLPSAPPETSLPDSQTPAPVTPVPAEPSADENFTLMDILCLVWLLGIAVMMTISVVSFLRLRRKLVGAAKLRHNIYLADHIDTPFVMGFPRARIYLPSHLTEREQGYILLHEQHHIKRLDHVTKAVAYLALCIHWFNPLVWLSFILASKDMEMSCDEAVMKCMDTDIRAEYSVSLLSLAAGRRIISGTPLAFGEGDTKSRIKNILNWKRPKTYVILVAAILCLAAVVFCAVNPEYLSPDTPDQTGDIQSDNAEENADDTQNAPDEQENSNSLNCTHSQFTIAFDSQPTRFTVVDWFYDNELLSQCDTCGKYPGEYIQTSFSDCLEGLKNGKYDVILLPCDSDLLSQLNGYTVVPIQRDAIIFVRSNSEELDGFDLTDEDIRRAFTSAETVYWDEAGTDPIIPASGGHDGATTWQQISRLFGFSPTSPNVVFIGQEQDNAPMAITDSGRSGSGLWPYYFSCRNGEAALNGEPISVNGISPSAQSIADGSYPYTFTYYAVYAPDNDFASEISSFVSDVQQLKYSLFETSDTLRFIQSAWVRSFNRQNEQFSLVGINGDKTHDVVVNGLLLQTLTMLYDQLELPKDPDTPQLLPHGIRIEIENTYRRHISIYQGNESPYVYIFLKTASTQEVSAVYSPQLYLYLTALAEKENATLADPDNDGFYEVFVWQYGENDLVIYDYYDGEFHRISTNEAIGCAASSYTGLIANIQPKYNNMIQAQDESGTVSVYQYRDGTFSYVCPLNTALGQENGNTSNEPDNTAPLVTISFNVIKNGFLFQADGSILAITGGSPVNLRMMKAEHSLVHNGWELTVEYAWARYGNALAVNYSSADYSLTPVTGSDRYLMLIIDGGYTYLIDVTTGEVRDPLAVLDEETAIRISNVSFSPSGQYAVITHHSGTKCDLLNCATGEITRLPYAANLYSVTGRFADNTHIVLTSAFVVRNTEEIRYSLSCYDITTGQLTNHGGAYTAKDRSDPNFLCFFDDGCLAYAFESGYLVIVDPVTMEKIATPFRTNSIRRVFYHSNALAGVIYDNTLYLLDRSGNCRAVCKVA